MEAIHYIGLPQRYKAGCDHPGQLAYYADEFTFRFNRRTSKARGLLFYRLLEHAVQIPPTTTAALAGQTGRGPGE